MVTISEKNKESSSNDEEDPKPRDILKSQKSSNKSKDQDSQGEKAPDKSVKSVKSAKKRGIDRLKDSQIYESSSSSSSLSVSEEDERADEVD